MDSDINSNGWAILALVVGEKGGSSPFFGIGWISVPKCRSQNFEGVITTD